MCEYGKDCAFAFRGHFEGVKASFNFNIIALDHKKKLKNNTLKPDTWSDGVIHSKICRTLNRWRAFVTLAVSTVKREFSGFHPPRISGICGVPGSPGIKKSTVCAHQMAVPGQRRTGNPR